MKDIERGAHESLREKHARRPKAYQRHAALSGDRRHWSPGRLERDECSLALRPSRVQDVHRNTDTHRGVDGHRMQHLRAERGELRGLVEADALEQPRAVDDARVRREHAVDVGPDLDCFRLQCRADQGRAVIRSAAAECRR